MGEYSKKLHFAKNGVTTDITLYDEFGAEVPVPALHYKHGEYDVLLNLYDSLADVGGDDAPCIYVEDAAQQAYAKLVSPDAVNATALRAKHNDVTYAVADSKNEGVVGLALIEPGGGAGTWAKVDINGNNYVPLDYNSLAPWSGIETVTIDEQTMVKIPKYYVKYGEIPAGRDNAGKKARWVSRKKLPGFHIHPAFVHNNRVMDCFYFGAFAAYEAESNKAGSKSGQSSWDRVSFPYCVQYCNNRNTDENDVEKRGWHLQNFYERCAINNLFLIENGTPNAQMILGNGGSNEGSTMVVYRGIHALYGHIWEYVEGLKCDQQGFYHISSNRGTGSIVPTGVAAPNFGSDSWIYEMSEEKGAEFDLTDAFVPSKLADSYEQGTYPDLLQTGRGTPRDRWLLVGGTDSELRAGLFLCDLTVDSNYSYSSVGFRIAKYGEITDEIAYDD